MSLAAPARAIVEAAQGTLFTACVIHVERGGVVDAFALGSHCPDPDAGADADGRLMASWTAMRKRYMASSFWRP
ncbi:MAG: hypothetical protein AAB295_08280, partial [Chloroflexota bacterium]